MSKNKVSVKGLQNIGAILGRSDAPQPAPNREKRDINGIINHTRAKVEAAAGLAPNGREQIIAFKSQRELLKTYITAGIREAYSVGHADALAQGSEVDKMLDKQYEVRTSLLTPTVVCAVMEQSGLSSMSLDLARMATVFERCDVQCTLDADTNIMSYTMRPASFFNGPLGHPEEIDPRDDAISANTTGALGKLRNHVDIEDDIRHQVEDIEQTAGPINVDSEQFEDKI